MAEIRKYIIDYNRTDIEMPLDSEILSIQNQHGKMVIWALTEPSKPVEIRTFIKVLTGFEMNEPSSRYIGTVQFDDGLFVNHLFEIIKR